jgi:hypothetical protein
VVPGATVGPRHRRSGGIPAEIDAFPARQDQIAGIHPQPAIFATASFDDIGSSHRELLGQTGSLTTYRYIHDTLVVFQLKDEMSVVPLRFLKFCDELANAVDCCG